MIQRKERSGLLKDQTIEYWTIGSRIAGEDHKFFEENSGVGRGLLKKFQSEGYWEVVGLYLKNGFKVTELHDCDPVIVQDY